MTEPLQLGICTAGSWKRPFLLKRLYKIGDKCHAQKLWKCWHSDNLSLPSQNCFKGPTTQATARQPSPSCLRLSLPWEGSPGISPRACCDQPWWSTFPAFLIRRAYFTTEEGTRGEKRKSMDINIALWNTTALAGTPVSLQQYTLTANNTSEAEHRA